MAHAGQEFEGYGGFRLRLSRPGRRAGGELLEMEASYPAGGQLPPEHLHPKQDERFEVLDGAVRAIIGGDGATGTRRARSSRSRQAHRTR